MKKIVSLISGVVLVFSLTACGNESASNVPKEDNAVVESSQVTESKVEWKDFLKEYDEWADKYIQIIKKYKESPTDLSILSDYTEMMNEVADWTEKTEAMEKELEKASLSELAEYSAELAKIAAKMAKAAF